MAVTKYHDAQTSITFVKATSKYNRRYVVPGKEVNTGKYEQHKVFVKDARPNKSDYTLEKQGFVLNNHESHVFILLQSVNAGNRFHRQ
jgi:hypothetical protein